MNSIPTQNQIRQHRKDTYWNSGKFAAAMMLYYPDLVEALYQNGNPERYERNEVKILVTLDDIIEQERNKECTVVSLEGSGYIDPNEHLSAKGHTIYMLLCEIHHPFSPLGYKESFAYVCDNKELHDLWFL